MWPRCSIANEMITVYNLNQAKNSVYGQGLVDRSANEDKSLYTGVEASFSARLPGGAMMFGSWTVEKNVSVFCETRRQSRMARRRATCTRDARGTGRPLLRSAGLQHAVPARVQAGGQLRAAVRHRRRRRHAELRAASSGSFSGRRRPNLFPNGQRTQSQTLIINEPGSLFSERWDQLDVNFKKNIRYGSKVHTFQLDIFNVFNNNSIRTMNDTVGTSLGQVTAIMPGRFPRLAYQFKW